VNIFSALFHIILKLCDYDFYQYLFSFLGVIEVKVNCRLGLT